MSFTFRTSEVVIEPTNSRLIQKEKIYTQGNGYSIYNETYHNINNYCNSKIVSKENTLLEDALEINSDKNTFGIKNRFIIGYILKEKNR